MSHNAIGLLKANGEIEEYGNTSGDGGGDTSALANKTDLTAIILTGTTNTSGDTITSGTWFYLNGVLVKAKADIASGATFTENTNYEAKTVGDELSELNSKIPSGGGVTAQYISIGRKAQSIAAGSYAYVPVTVPQDKQCITCYAVPDHYGFNVSVITPGGVSPTSVAVFNGGIAIPDTEGISIYAIVV